MHPVGGGCIAHAQRLETARGPFFLKSGKGLGFEAEAAGLRALREAAEGTGLCVPEVLHVSDEEGILLLEWIDEGPATPAYWEGFGHALAALHRASAEDPGNTRPRYGFDGDNRIGRLPQRNDWRDDWAVFFRDLRLGPQLERARAGGHWSPRLERLSQALLDRLHTLLPSGPPASPLHGDLWSGNQLSGANGRAWLIDPAAYYGDREADLAMTELFGAFPSRFYAAYREAWPQEPGYDERRDLYNLYHLLNHLNHFGGSYASSVASSLERLERAGM